MALENWLNIGKLKEHKTTQEEMAAIFSVVERDIQDASLKGLSSDRKFNLAYSAAFEASLALLYCNGYSPAKESHHYMTWQALKDILDTQHRGLIDYFDACRKKRNILDYDMAGMASEKEAKEIYEKAKKFVDMIKHIIKKQYTL